LKQVLRSLREHLAPALNWRSDASTDR
jgi:hypothetical protein